MRLQSFRVRNYKSIVDSGPCRLSDNDNILVLAGQNESGKSSGLQALRDYESGELQRGALRHFPIIQYPEIECTYVIEDDDNLFEAVTDDVENIPTALETVFSKLKTVTLIRRFTSLEDAELSFDDGLKQKIADEIEIAKKVEAAEAEPTPTPEETTTPPSPAATATAAKPVAPAKKPDPSLAEMAEAVFQIAPKIIFFDDFCDLLPDHILVSDLTAKNTESNGYSAVKNIETVLDADFTKLDELEDAPRASSEEGFNTVLTANFNEKWRQKIFGNNIVKIAVKHQQGRKEGGAYLNFFVLTKDGEYLAPEQRSRGLQWFLSFYLQLKAENKKTEDLIILFDEPGLYLHAKAQEDIKNLFEELAQKAQIIYSTHSPYLIDTKKLHRVRLVLNSKEGGTTIEKITTNKVIDQKDALKPIIDAMGLEIAHGFSPMQKQNVILEGISDFHYFTAMKKLLGISGDFAFVPSMGASNVHLLMELCTGWGLEWLIILDDGKASKTAYNQIKKSFFDDRDDDAQKKIFVMEGMDGIEDAFSNTDLQIVEPEAKFPEGIKKSQKVHEYGGKELFSRRFLEMVDNGDITKEKLTKTAIKNFEKAFRFIEASFNPIQVKDVAQGVVERVVAETLAKNEAAATKLAK